MNKEEILNNETRREILGYVKGNPGTHFNLIKQSLELKNGSLAYHLNVLEKEGHIKSFNDGLKRRFYPKEIKVQEGEFYLSNVQEEILQIIKANNGISQKEISEMVGKSRQIIGYHLNLLEKNNKIKSVKNGREIRYYEK